jgi:hypothetical protein
MRKNKNCALCGRELSGVNKQIHNNLFWLYISLLFVIGMMVGYLISMF